MHDFTGAKIALLVGNKLITILNKDVEFDRDANKWDLLGGGREGDESPKECAIRRVQKQLNIRIEPNEIIYIKQYDSVYSKGAYAYFLVAKIEQWKADSIVLGEDSESFKLVPIQEYLEDEKAVKYCKDRIKEYLIATK